MSLEKILIVGAGNGGQAAAVDLTKRGFNVCLYEFPEFSDRLKDKLASQTIPATGFVEGEIKIDLITTDEKEALKYSKTILVTMPAFGHPRVLDAFKDRLQEGSNVYFFPGNLSTLATSENTKWSERGTTFVEFNSLPYGCRVSERGVVKIGIRTSLLTYAAFPARNTDKVVDEIEQLYPGQRQNTDILEVSLNNPNPLIHPPGVLLNLGRIEHSQGQFYMYNEGMTDSILRVIKAMDAEREKIGHELGYQLVGLEEFGGILLDGTRDSFINCGKSAQMLGPCDRNNRYLTEDVPFGLTYWREIARKIGVSTPNIDAVTTLTATICDLPVDNRLIDKIKSLPAGILPLRDFFYNGEL